MTVEDYVPPDDLAKLLFELGEAVSDHVLRHRDPHSDFEERGFEGGDTIYAIDRLVEPIILSHVDQWPKHLKPIVVVAEGMGENGQTLLGEDFETPKFRLLVDPIDGTRGIMYDKRSAWFLAAIAPDKGPETRLRHVVASAMVEIPTGKQHLADAFYASEGSKTIGERRNVLDGRRFAIEVRPSSSADLKNGFAQVSNFFPGTKVLASELMEEIAKSSEGKIRSGEAPIFDDQYISTGGQFVQLIDGKDRFCCDLRPLFYEIIERQGAQESSIGLQCHPYDIAGLLTAKQAGVIITDGWGRELDAPFDLTTPVHWCGYANKRLQQRIQPVIRNWLTRYLG